MVVLLSEPQKNTSSVALPRVRCSPLPSLLPIVKGKCSCVPQPGVHQPTTRNGFHGQKNCREEEYITGGWLLFFILSLRSYWTGAKERRKNGFTNTLNRLANSCCVPCLSNFCFPFFCLASLPHSMLTKSYPQNHDNSGSMLLGSILFATLLAIKSVPLRLSIHPLLPSSSFLSPASFFIALEVLCRVLLLSLQLDAEPFDDAGQHAAKLWFLVVLMVWHIHLTFQLSTHRGTMAVVAVRLATSSFQDASFDEDWLVDMSLRAIRLLDEAPSIAHDPSTTRWVCMTRCTIPLLLVLLHLSSPSAFLLFASSVSTTTTMTMMKTMCWMLMTLALLEWKMVNEVKEEPSGRLVLLTGVRVFSHALVRWFLDWKVFAGRVFASSWLKTKKDRRPTNGASPSPCRIHLGSANNKQEEEEGEKGKQSESCGSKEKRSHRETELRVEERRKEQRARIMKHVPVSSVDPKQVSRVKLRRRGSTQGGVQEIVVVQF